MKKYSKNIGGYNIKKDDYESLLLDRGELGLNAVLAKKLYCKEDEMVPFEEV